MCPPTIWLRHISLEVRLRTRGRHRHRAVARAGVVSSRLLPRLVRDLPPDLGGVRVVGDDPLDLAALGRAAVAVLGAARAALGEEVEVPAVDVARPGPGLQLGDYLLIGDQQIVLADQVFYFFGPRISKLLPFRLQFDKGAVLGSEPVEGCAELIGLLQHVPVTLGDGGNVVKLYVLVQAGAEQLLRRVAQDQRHPLVHVGELAVCAVSVREEVKV